MESSEPIEQETVSALAKNMAFAAVVVLLCNVVLVVIDVLMRWLFRQPQSWVSDISELTYPIAIVLCFPAGIEAGSMIVIRFLGGVIGKRGGWVLDCFGQASLTALLGLFTTKVFERGLSDWATGYATLTLRLPIAPTWLLVSALLAVATLFQARRTWMICAGHIENV